MDQHKSSKSDCPEWSIPADPGVGVHQPDAVLASPDLDFASHGRIGARPGTAGCTRQHCHPSGKRCSLLTLLKRLHRGCCRRRPVAALFALHPLHVRSVAWIAERKDLLSTLFFLAALIRHNYVKGRRSLRISLLRRCFALSLMCKPMFVTLPVLLLVLDYWPIARFDTTSSFARRCLEKSPLAILSVASGS